MGIGRIKITQKKYRLPKKISAVSPELVYPAPVLFFNFINNTGHTFVINSPENLIWEYNPTTGHLTVEGISTDEYLTYNYRGTDGHVTQTV